jgi:hypothetical protein
LRRVVPVAASSKDPDDPVSHIGLDTAGLYLDTSTIDPWKTNWPTSDLRVDVSYAGGSSQPVEVLAKRAAGAVTLHYSVNGAAEQTGPTSESPDGERYGGNNAYNNYYHYLRGQIPGLKQGDSVRYWFSGGGETTERVAFDVVEDSDDADVLILAAGPQRSIPRLPQPPDSQLPVVLRGRPHREGDRLRRV